LRLWPRLPREAVAAPSLAVLKARMDGALSTLGWGKMSLLMAGGLEPDELQGPCQPKPFCDSMIKVFLFSSSFPSEIITNQIYSNNTLPSPMLSERIRASLPDPASAVPFAFGPPFARCFPGDR